MRDDDIILESETLVDITQKNVEDTIAFIEDSHYTAEMVDIPGDVYGRIYGQVEEAAIRAMQKELKDGIYEDDQVVLQTVLPVDLLNLLPQELLEKLDQDIINEVYEQVEEPEEDNARVVEFTPITDAELAEMEPDWVVMDEDICLTNVHLGERNDGRRLVAGCFTYRRFESSPFRSLTMHFEAVKTVLTSAWFFISDTENLFTQGNPLVYVDNAKAVFFL